MKAIYYFLSILFFLPYSSFAQSPRTLSYQGVLTDSEGEALPDNTYTLTLGLYDAASSGNLLWEEDIATEVSGGLFNVILGETEILDLAFDQPYWLGIAIDGGEELSPRTALTSSPYSLGGRATELDLAGVGNFKNGIIIDGSDTTLYIIPLVGGMYMGPDSSANGLREEIKTRANTIEEINAGESSLSVKQLHATAKDGPAIVAGTVEAPAILADSRNSYGLFGISKKSSAIFGQGLSAIKPAIHGLNKSGTGVFGESDFGPGVFGKSKESIGIKGEGALYGVEAIGVGEVGTGIFASGSFYGIRSKGDFAAARFDGDVLIEEMGQLKIDNVKEDNSDKILVWSDNKFVKYRSIEDLKDDSATDEFQTLTLVGDQLSISNGNSVTLPASGSDMDADPMNEIQELSISGKTISISQGNSITLPDNETQTISKDGSVIMLDKMGGNVQLEDDDAENELQTISKDGPIITLDKEGGIVQLEDDDKNNELQKLTKDGDVISLDQNGGNISLMDDDPNNELFTGTLCDKELVVKFGEDSIMVVDAEGRVGVEGAFGAHATTDLPALTGAAEDNVSGFFFNDSPFLPTVNIQNIQYGPGLAVTGSAFFADSTFTRLIVDPLAPQVLQVYGDQYVQGNIQATGTVTGSGKSFLIDHPMEPTTKQLRHFSIESDRLTNIYNGNLIMDDNGEAWVELPDWFEALNTDFSYQLTCVGGFANVYIAEEMQGNRFKIAGGKKGLKVSWQVSGVRHDRQSLEIDQSVEILKQ